MADLTEAVRLVKGLHGLIRYVKIGSVLFTASGPTAIQRLRALGCEIFLDLKFHDIPSTVERSCRAAVRHRVAMLTVHACGGREMLSAAARGIRREAKRLGISYLNGQRGLSSTANGVTQVYIVSLNSVKVGDISLNGIQGIVHESAMPVVLLGMSFLNRVNMKREGNHMVLTKRF